MHGSHCHVKTAAEKQVNLVDENCKKTAAEKLVNLNLVEEKYRVLTCDKFQAATYDEHVALLEAEEGDQGSADDQHENGG